jgi:hypothetical protein
MGEVLEKDSEGLVVAHEAKIEALGGRHRIRKSFDECAGDLSGAGAQERADIGFLLPVCDREDHKADAVAHRAPGSAGDVPELRERHGLAPAVGGLVERLDDHATDREVHTLGERSRATHDVDVARVDE